MTQPHIIAEVGSNWKTLTEALDSISAAKKVGADSVKFQLFDWESLYGVSQEPYNGGAGRTYKIHKQLDHDWIPKLAEKAAAVGIEFLCTAFSPELLAVVDPYVAAHKIASSDLNYVALLEAAKATGKPIMLSVGASNRFEIGHALDVLKGSDVILLYCNSSYPSKRHNLFHIESLFNTFGLDVGLSDHSTDIYTPLSAWRHFHVPVIEKHFNATAHTDTPDAPHSLGVDDFQAMVDAIRHEGEFMHRPTVEEKDMMLRHNRRLIATKDINIGTCFEYGANYGAYRSLVDDSHGLSPFCLRNVRASPEGKVAKKFIAAGCGIGLGDF